MTLSSLNSFLLRTIVKNFRLGSDPPSLLRRHETLSIIYANFSLILMITFYELVSVILGMKFHNLPAMVLPFIIASFVCLRNGKNDPAAIFVLIYAHMANGYVSHFKYSSVGALAAIFIFPNFSFFMSSSTSVQLFNTSICILQVFGHIWRIREVFAVTLTQEQSDEINHMIAVAIPCLSTLCFTLIAQKSVENHIWQAACMAQEKSDKINREIMQAVEAKDSFISSLSHEIRNPLNAMNGSINYLLQVIRDPQSQQVLHNARISGETLLNLFTNLLDAAKLKSEKMELSYDDTNLYETLKKVLIINCENIKHKRIFVNVFINQDIPQIIRSDAARLLQILMNLMSNAVKFTPEGGKIVISATICHKGSTEEQLESLLKLPASSENPTPAPMKMSQDVSHTKSESDRLLPTEEFSEEEAQVRIENLKRLKQAVHQVNASNRPAFFQDQPWKIQKIDMSVGGQKTSQGIQLDVTQNLSDMRDYYLKIQITDNGCGIAEENIHKLFEMFTQAHKRVTSSHGGTGLGLWICKQLCQKMGGDIKLYSKLNQGTSFVFYLPVSNRDSIQHEVSLESEITTRQCLDKTSCLVVDDYSYNRDLYKLLLEREGVQVVVGNDGEEAIKKYLANVGKLDFILMDVQMPKMDGFTAARKIRELEAMNKWRRVDIYFVSGEYYNEQEVMASFKTQSGNEQTLGIQSLKKPIDIEVISKVAAKYTKKGN